MPKLSILIPTTKPTVFELLNSIRGQQYHELLLDIEKGSPATRRNRLANKATGDIILFLDDDIIIAKNFIEQGLKQFKGKFAQSKVVGMQSNSPNKFIGTAMWFRKDFFNELKGFDESYPFFNEDLDLYIRAKKLGVEPDYLDNSICFHEQNGNYEKLIIGNDILKAKHPEFYKDLKKELR